MAATKKTTKRVVKKAVAPTHYWVVQVRSWWLWHPIALFSTESEAKIKEASLVVSNQYPARSVRVDRVELVS